MGKKFGTKLTTKELNKLTRELVMLLSWHSSKEMIYRVGVVWFYFFFKVKVPRYQSSFYLVQYVLINENNKGSKIKWIISMVLFWDTFFFYEKNKVIHPKYSKHWPYPVAYTIDCVCSKMLNHGLNHGLFLTLFKLIPCLKLNCICVSLSKFQVWILKQF